MTGLEKIVSEIQHAAQLEAEGLIATTQAEASALMKASKDKAAARCKEIVASAQRNADDSIRRSRSSVDLQHRQDMLAIKQMMLKETLSMAEGAVGQEAPQTYKALLTKLAQSTKGTGEGTLQVNQRDQSLITPEFLAAFPKDLTVTLDPTPVNIKGGFLLQTGDIIINSSIEAIFDRYKDRFTDLALDILFD